MPALICFLFDFENCVINATTNYYQSQNTILYHKKRSKNS
jgi:hypothetical protein